jgi:hypothetical protein
MDITRQSILHKLETYTLNPFQVEGRHKARWFRRALGFTNLNSEALANQIHFYPRLAIPFRMTRFGIIYLQYMTIMGTNGRIIKNVRVSWFKERNTGLIRLSNILPPKEKV